jgi:acetyltransferase-like isoleucine patch superfamily enzyme
LESAVIERELQELYAARRDAMRTRFDRDLPFDELVFDRWERAAVLGFGRESSIYHLSYVYGDVKVGEHTWVGPSTLLDGTGGLSIGSWCAISAGAQIYTHDSAASTVTGGAAPTVRQSVTIEDCCFIGPLSIVTMGVRIGAHSVVGGHSFVNRDVDPYSIVVGTPARKIGRVVIEGHQARFVYEVAPEHRTSR